MKSQCREASCQNKPKAELPYIKASCAKPSPLPMMLSLLGIVWFRPLHCLLLLQCALLYYPADCLHPLDPLLYLSPNLINFFIIMYQVGFDLIWMFVHTSSCFNTFSFYATQCMIYHMLACQWYGVVNCYLNSNWLQIESGLWWRAYGILILWTRDYCTNM